MNDFIIGKFGSFYTSYITSSCKHGQSLGAIGASNPDCVRCPQTGSNTVTCLDKNGKPIGAAKKISVMSSGQAAPKGAPQANAKSYVNPFQAATGNSSTGIGAGSSASASGSSAAKSVTSGSGNVVSGSSIRTGVELLPEAVQEAIDPVIDVYEDVGDRIESAGLPPWLLPVGIVAGLGLVLFLVLKK